MTSINLSKYDRTNLKDVSLRVEDGEFYLYLTYECECKESIDEIVYQKLHLPISKYNLPFVDFELFSASAFSIVNESFTVHLPFGDLNSHSKEAVTVKTIENKTQKLTLAEIEKKLGYKIELVSEEVG